MTITAVNNTRIIVMADSKKISVLGFEKSIFIK